MANRRVADWIKSYMRWTAASEAPTQYHFWTAVFTIAAALRRKCYIDQRPYYVWFPNFYLILVGKAGIVQKTSAIEMGFNLLKQVPGIHFAADSTTWQALIEDLAKAKDYIEIDGRTIPMCNMTAYVGELGTFLNMEDKDMVNNLITLWDGKDRPYRKATKHSGRDTVVNPWLNIAGGTTPSWIRENFREYMLGGGFISRCVFVYASEKRHYNAYPKWKNNSEEEMERLEKDLVHDLQEIAELQGEFTLTEDAVEWGQIWYEELMKNTPRHLQDERMGGYLARKQTHVHKLAMVLSASARHDMVIDMKTLETAANMVSALEGDFPLIFESIGQSVEGEIASFILRLVAHYAPIPRYQVIERLYKRVPSRIAHEAIKTLIEAGKVKMTNEKGTVYLHAKD